MPKRPQSRKTPSSTPEATKSLKTKPKKKALSVAQSVVEPTRQTVRGIKRLNYERWRHNRHTYNSERSRVLGVWPLTRLTAVTLWRYRRVLLCIVLIYGILNIILVQGFASSSDISSLRADLRSALHGKFSGAGSSAALFIVILSASGTSSTSTGGGASYQFVLIVLASLALIWTLRQELAGVRVRARDAYYKGVYPFVPFILVLLVIALQLIPLLVGSLLYSLVSTNGIAASGLEQIIWLLVFAGLALLSLYFVSSSVFALYIVTLPDMTPMKALRSARELVRYRRWTLLLRVLYLPILLLVLTAVLMTPIIFSVTSLAEWVFFLLSILSIAVVHSYMYTLYRELLNE